MSIQGSINWACLDVLGTYIPVLDRPVSPGDLMNHLTIESNVLTTCPGKSAFLDAQYRKERGDGNNEDSSASLGRDCILGPEAREV